MFALFAPIWVIAFFVHHSEDWQPISITVLSLLATLWILWSRQRVLPFLISITAFAGIQWQQSPFLANHSNFYMFVNFFLLAWMGLHYVRHKKWDEEQLEADFSSMRGILCLSLFVVYLMAGVHKLNTDFFNPQVSCASDFFIRYAEEYKFDPSWIPKFLTEYAPALVGIVEVGGAFMLLIPRLQLLGVLSFVGLHSYLAPLSFFDFATICYSILLLYLPAAIVATPERRERLEKGLRIWIGAMIIGALIAVAMMDSGLLPIKQDVMQGWTFLFGSFYFMAQVYRNLKDAGLGLLTPQMPTLWQIRPRWYYILPLLLLIYTNTSYLGLRTAGNTTMFSNLRTEGGVSNHLFMPQWLQIFDYQKSLVYVVAVSDEVRHWYREMPQEEGVMVEFELRRMVDEWRKKGLFVPMTIVFNGEEKTYDDITQSPFWTTPEPSYWLQKLMLFREVQAHDGPNLCRW